MFNFWYKRENPASKFTIALALIVLAAAVYGAVTLARPAIKAAKDIIKSRRDAYRLIVLKPKDCATCFDIYQVSDYIKDLKGITYKKAKEYTAGSQNAELLIKTYQIKNLPTIIIQGDVSKLGLKDTLDESSIAHLDDKTFVYNNLFPPYYNLEEKKVRGEFNITYLTDASCKECYDVHLHDRALENLAMKPATNETIDVSSDEGKNLVDNYQIKFVPTMILKGDLDAYKNFKQLWDTVGTVEGDGAYVFREAGLDLMGVYKNLKTGKLITPKE